MSLDTSTKRYRRALQKWYRWSEKTGRRPREDRRARLEEDRLKEALNGET